MKKKQFHIILSGIKLTAQFPTKFPLLVDYVACLFFCLFFFSFAPIGFVKKFSHI